MSDDVPRPFIHFHRSDPDRSWLNRYCWTIHTQTQQPVSRGTQKWGNIITRTTHGTFGSLAYYYRLPARTLVKSNCLSLCVFDGWVRMKTRWGRGAGFTSLRSLFSALKVSEVGRPNLHLCKFNGVLVALPVEPVDPLWKSRMQMLESGSNRDPPAQIHQKEHDLWHWRGP